MPDQILYWNQIATEAIKYNHTSLNDKLSLGPVQSAKILGMLHLALYDALLGTIISKPIIPCKLRPYNLIQPASINSNFEVAIATSAYKILCHFYPSQIRFFDSSYKEAGLVQNGFSNGHEYGLYIADLMIDSRREDPTISDLGYPQQLGIGKHKRSPNNDNEEIHAPFFGKNTSCFSVTKRHQIEPPPAIDSKEYINSLVLVKNKGNSSFYLTSIGEPNRSDEELIIGNFWGYDGSVDIGTPPRLYNQIVRQIAIDKGNNIIQNAHLFALVNTAMADAGILCWESKYKYNHWRPVIGIREYPGKERSVNWLPLGAPKSNSNQVNITPPFPAYPSGHATFGAASLHMVRLFYGGSEFIGHRDKDNFLTNMSGSLMEFISDEYNGQTKDSNGSVRPLIRRKFTDGLWQMILENAWSRVYLGVHWDFDSFITDENYSPDLTKNIGGVPLGLKIAEDIYSRYLINGENRGIIKSIV